MISTQLSEAVTDIRGSHNTFTVIITTWGLISIFCRRFWTVEKIFSHDQLTEITHESVHLVFWSCPWKRQFHNYKYQIDQASLIPAHSIDIFDLWSVPVVCVEATHEDTLCHETHWIALMSQSESRITSVSRSYHQQNLSVPWQRHKCLWWIALEWAFPET